MKLITTLAMLSVMMIIVGQAYSSHLENQTYKLERRVKSNNKADPPTSATPTTPTTQDEDPNVVPFGAEDTRFLILGDTGQVDKYFKDFIQRSVTADVEKIEELSDGKFSNFDSVMNVVPKDTFKQGIILGDFLYTESKHKKAGITLSDYAKETTRTINYTNPKDKKLENVTTTFDNRVKNSSIYLKNLLEKTYKDKAPFWLLETGNHSYDVDASLERQTVGEGKDASTVRMYKHSKVHISKHACFADLNLGDIVCLNQKYEDCFKGPLGSARYGRNEAQTLASLSKVIEALLTLKLCKSRWRIIRTHAAPYNTEIDQHYLFNKINGKIQCRVRKALPGLDVGLDYKDLSEVLEKLKASTVDLTAAMLQTYSPAEGKDKKQKIQNRIFECNAEDKAWEKTPSQFSVLEIINKAAPHFYLGSHLHASQLLFAPKNPQSYNFNAFKQSDERTDEINGCKEINNVKTYQFTPGVEQMPGDCSPLTIEDTIQIKKDEPDYNIIFVIGNSGRFLDNFSKGTESASYIVWQRINSPKGLPAQMMKDKKNTVEKILEADNHTAYGYADLEFHSNDKLTISYIEVDRTDLTKQTPKVVLKITLDKEKNVTVPNLTLLSNYKLDRDAKKARKLK